jgi:hypothetical protein
MHAHTNARLTLCRGDTHFLILTEPIQPSFEFSSCVRAELILSTLPAVVNWCPKRCVCFLSSRHSAALGLRCSLHHCHCPLCADYPSTVRQATTAPARARTHTHTHTHTHTLCSLATYSWPLSPATALHQLRAEWHDTSIVAAIPSGTHVVTKRGAVVACNANVETSSTLHGGLVAAIRRKLNGGNMLLDVARVRDGATGVAVLASEGHATTMILPRGYALPIQTPIHCLFYTPVQTSSEPPMATRLHSWPR